MAQRLKHPPAMWETWVRSLSQEDPLENEMATMVFPSYVWIGEGNGTSLQYSCLKNPMEGEAWWAAVHGVVTRLSDFTFTFHFHALEKAMGDPFQCSFLENPRDRGAWWASIYGVTQSRTRLK